MSDPIRPAARWWRDRGVQAGLVGVLLIALLDQLSRVPLNGGYAIGAFVASIVTTGRRTAGVAVLAVLLSVVGNAWHPEVSARDWLVRVLICVALGTLAVVSAAMRERREMRMRRLAVIAETAQRAVLGATPTAVGAVGFASRYLSASEDASVGGDLYEVASTPYGVRVILGDVRGKGLPAVQTAASVLAAFRQAAFTEPDPAALARAIDGVISRLIDEEEFITAIFAEFRGDSVVLANCGHHPPLLVDQAGARLLDTGEPTPPLGLQPEPELVRHPWSSPARLLLYTDGLVEARDSAGEFFGLDDTAPLLSGRPLAESLDAVVERLRVFAGGRLADDVALVLAENRTA